MSRLVCHGVPVTAEPMFVQEPALCGERIRVIGVEKVAASEKTDPLPEVVILGGRTLYYVVYDRTSREGPVPIPGETVGEFTVYTTADTFDVLP